MIEFLIKIIDKEYGYSIELEEKDSVYVTELYRSTSKTLTRLEYHDIIGKISNEYFTKYDATDYMTYFKSTERSIYNVSLQGL